MSDITSIVDHMSQVARLLGVKVTGQVFLGVDDAGTPAWSAHPHRVARWMADGWRTRFNQHRSQRHQYVYGYADQAGADEKGRVLVRLGNKPVPASDKQARVIFPHLAALPMQVLQSPERIENTEWFAAVKRRQTTHANGHKSGRMPRFRSRKNDDARFVCWFNGGKNATYQRTGKRTGMLTLRGMNPTPAPDGTRRWQLRLRLRHTQDIREYTSVQVNLTTMQVTFTSPPAARAHTFNGEVAGIDLGIMNTVATSDGQFLSLPDMTAHTTVVKRHQRRMAKARRVAATQGRDARRSRRYQAHKAAAAQAAAKTARVRADWAHKTANLLVDRYDVLGLEDLRLANMTRSAKGTIAAPGRNVRQKAGLNRAMLNASLGRLREYLEYKGAAAGITVLPVPAHYTSQRCRSCGHIASGNRESQAVFECVACGHTAHADTNAAGNILDAALGAWATASQTGSTTKTRPVPAVRARAMNREPTGARPRTVTAKPR